MNLEDTIIPKSDQLNADDLIAGPRTITITSVTKGSAEQPVIVHYEGEDGRPYKPGKSMRRVLVAMWGPEAKAYTGRRLTLYRDPSVKFGGQEVGGIKISHATGINDTFVIALTETRGKRHPHRVEPLIESATKQTSQSADFDLSSLADVGETKARQGTAALRDWWMSLPVAARAALTAQKDSEWKPLAEDADAAK